MREETEKFCQDFTTLVELLTPKYNTFVLNFLGEISEEHLLHKGVINMFSSFVVVQCVDRNGEPNERSKCAKEVGEYLVSKKIADYKIEMLLQGEELMKYYLKHTKVDKLSEEVVHSMREELKVIQESWYSSE